MIDVITYTNDLQSLKSWIEANKDAYSEISHDESGTWLNIAKVPTKVNGNASVSLVRVKDLAFLNVAPLELLATAPVGMNVFEGLSVDATNKIESVLNRQTVDIINEGVKVGEYTEPFQFGAIA